VIARGIALLLLLLFATGVGCGRTIQTRVVKGEITTVGFVPTASPGLDGPGVSGVRITFTRDPTSPGRKVIAEATTDERGAVAVQLDSFGAGMLEEEWLVEAYAPGYETASQILRLPFDGSGNRLLITLVPGRAVRPARPDDYLQDYERYR
jgi:hypothetical protein